MNIYFITYKFQHHYLISGYNRLAEFLPCREITIPPRVNRTINRFFTFKMWEDLRKRTGLPGYYPECLYLEWHARLRSFLPGRRLFHFAYPENSLYFTAKRKRSSKTKLVATYHQPPEESRQFIIKTDALKQLDAVILLSESQRAFFEPVVGKEKIHIVPHGIDLKFFTPPVLRSPNRKIIAVGNWL
ncbi:MAG TPA: glycosyltransferase, partial [Bacteroidota bacterium]|nr:glycosyltransferase [Bacteroidota bacterium]